MASFISVQEDYATIYRSEEQEYTRQSLWEVGSVCWRRRQMPTIGIGRTNPVNNWTDEVGHASLKAMDPNTRKKSGSLNGMTSATVAC